MSNKTGGPAFPWCGDLNECPTINLGLSIRDYFAAKAMQAAMMNVADWKYAPNQIAMYAYVQADAMLKAREA